MTAHASTLRGSNAADGAFAPARVLAYAAASLHSTPTTWDTPVDLGPRVAWGSGAPRRAYLGPHESNGMSAWSQSVGVGDGFAYAQVTGLSYGPLSLSRVIVTCLGEHYAVQIDGGASGHALHPGEHLRVDGVEIDVGRVERHEDGSYTVTGLSLSSNTGGLLTVAVAHAGPVR